FTARLTRATIYSLVLVKSGCGRRSETEHLLRARGVGLGNLDGARHLTGDLGGLLLEVVTLAGLLPKDLAGPGHPEALARTGVRLVLRHLCSLFSSCWGPRRDWLRAGDRVWSQA